MPIKTPAQQDAEKKTSIAATMSSGKPPAPAGDGPDDNDGPNGDAGEQSDGKPLSLQDVMNAPDDSVFAMGDDGKTMSKDEVLQQMRQQQSAVRANVIAQRNEWVTFRAQSGVEDRFRAGKALYDGDEVPDSTFVDTLKNGPSPRRKAAAEEANRSRVNVNIIRPKVDQAIARMCEILLPVDDKNWGIRPTPVPNTVQKMVGNDAVTVLPGSVTPQTPQGTPNPDGTTADQEAQEFIEQARVCADAMQDEIDDQLTQCRYNAEQREAITDGCKLGTGIMLGPFPAKQCSKAWVTKQGPDGKTINGLVYTEETVPASCHADPWDVWFDPAAGKDHQNGAGFWHKKMVTRKQIRQLNGVLGFDPDALAKVLLQAPTRVTTAQGRVKQTQVQKEQAYEMWTYHGELEPDHVTIMSQNTGDQLDDVDFGVVMLINDEVVGVMPSWIPDKTLPVDVWCWRESDDSPYGFGVPHGLEHQQRVVTAAWRQVMDNARYAVGSQIVFMKGVVPVDGHNTIYPGKAWVVDPEKIDDVTKAMMGIDFPSHLQDLLAIAEKAMEFADQESSMPQIIGGEKGAAPETLGGTVMLYNNAQAVLRMRVKLYDDNITSRHITRYYDWNMANNPRQDIKGDMQVDARGSTALLEKDIQNQATINLANVTNNPRYAPFLDAENELKVILKAFKILPETIMATDAQITKNLQQPPAPDPKVVASQTALQIKQLDVQDKQAARQATAQQDEVENQVRAATLEYNERREQAQYTVNMTETQNARDLQEEKMAQEERITAAQLEAQTGIKHLEIDTKRQIFNADAALRVKTGQGVMAAS